MGILSASVSLSRFEVIGEFPEDGFWEWFSEKLLKYAFKEIEDTIQEQGIGWVSAEDSYDSQFAYQSFKKGEYALFSLRIDKRRVPSSLLKKHVEMAYRKRLKETGRSRLTTSEKKDFKAAVYASLLQKTLPVPSVYDICWRISDNMLWFTSLSAKVQDLFTELFKTTFNLNLRPLIPYVLAERLLNEEKSKDTLADIGPTLFSGPRRA